MAEFPALPLWTDAYLADTRHLTRDQHGAYLLLLMEAWRRPKCSLPDEDTLLAKLSCSTIDEWNALKPVVMSFWKLDLRTKEWRQKRLTSEHYFVSRKRALNRDAAVRRWTTRRKGDANAMPTQCRNDAPTPTPTPLKKAYANERVSQEEKQPEGSNPVNGDIVEFIVSDILAGFGQPMPGAPLRSAVQFAIANPGDLRSVPPEQSSWIRLPDGSFERKR